MKSVLTADLGGTKCRCAVVAEDLRVLGVVQEDTAVDPDAFLATLERMLRSAAAARPAGIDEPAAIGIGIAGVVASDHDRVRTSPNLPLTDFALGRHVADATGLATVVVNDGRASAMGEFRHGFAAGADPLLVLFFGTGVGIGVIVGGSPLEGATGAAGEIGHTIHRPGGRTGPDGRAGTFEAYCGGKAITQRAASEIARVPPGRPHWTVGDVVAAAGEDPRAAAILADAETAACSLVANAVTLFNPAAVVLGGGVLKGWPTLRPAIEAFVRRFCKPVVVDGLRFVASRGESDAILWGAAEATGVLW